MISIFKLRTVCGYIRGTQVAKFVGAKLNPRDGYENDVCIYVKMGARGGRKQWLDFLDGPKYIKHVKKNPDLGAIAVSRLEEEYLKNEIKNDVVFIPQQHVNFANVQRNRMGVTVAGWCGARGCFEAFESEIRDALAKIDIELKTCYDYHTRQDVIDFYAGIDIQIVWRMQANWNYMLKNPLKISNAGSFGIPTISKPEPCSVKEYGGCFCEATTMPELVECAKRLKNDEAYYKNIADKARERARDYHINKVAERYKALDV